MIQLLFSLSCVEKKKDPALSRAPLEKMPLPQAKARLAARGDNGQTPRVDTYEKHRYDRGKPIPVNAKSKVKIVPYFCR
jgi:hypothetical protein